MTQTEPSRPQYPPPEESNQVGYYAGQQSPRGPASSRDERTTYRAAEPARQGQYASSDPRTPTAYAAPPGQWPSQQHGAYPPPTPTTHHYPDPQHAAYHYPPPRADLTGPPQPLQPDAYRLPPPYPPHPYQYPYHAPPAPAPAPRQRTAIACKYCRKRKIRCSGYDSSPDGRCQNCVRFNQQCLFHPVSSQATFVPASVVYGPNARAPPAGGAAAAAGGERAVEGGAYARNGEQPPMLYGAHGQPLGPAGPAGQPQYAYPPPGYPPYPYPPPPPPPPPAAGHYATAPQPGHSYEPPSQAPPSAHPAHPAQDDRVSLKRPPPDDDPQSESSHAVQSPHPSSRARLSTYDSHATSSGSNGYADSPNQTSTSPATSIMSAQAHNGTVSPPAGLTPSSVHGFQSPHTGPARDEGKSPPPNQPGSAGSSVNGRSGMRVHEMLGNHHGGPTELRGRSDNEMLSKLDGKK